jgi:hypothetical protein
VLEERRDVLEEDDGGFDFPDDADEVRPESALVVVPSLIPGHGVGLTGEPRSDEIHDATPRSAIEGREIVPDRRAIQGLVFHPRHENGRGESVPLAKAHGSIAHVGELEPEVDSSDPGT